MNKRFAIAWLLTFVGWMAGGFVVHGALLHDDYAQYPNLFRPDAEAQQYLSLMVLAHVSLAGALVWIYSRGVEDRPWLGQGLRFGAGLAMLTIVPTYTIYYVVQPIAATMAVRQIVFDGILLLLLSVLVAFLYRDGKRN